MNGTIKPSRKTGGRAAALFALVAVLLLAPAAWRSASLNRSRALLAACTQTGSGGACQDGTALDGAFDLAASPDGRNVYVTSNESGAVVVFDRDPATGVLTQKPGTAGCISETGTGGACQDGTASTAPTGLRPVRTARTSTSP